MPAVAQLNWRAMLYFRMRDCKVVRFIPRRAAAPSGPPTWPLASSSAFRIVARSASGDSAGDLSCNVIAAGLPMSSGIAT